MPKRTTSQRVSYATDINGNRLNIPPSAVRDISEIFQQGGLTVFAITVLHGKAAIHVMSQPSMALVDALESTAQVLRAEINKRDAGNN